MSRPISITGLGAVSPAGWGVQPLMDALASGTPVPTSPLEREVNGKTILTPVRRVPAEGATTPKFARLRRTSPISKFAAAAAAEALGEDRLAGIASGQIRVGVIFTLTNGCVNYSNRFFGEALADPAMASPIFFPETVFNAPSSHISAMIGSTAANDTIIGDSSGFFTGIDLAAEWLLRGDLDGCLVVSAEEIDWLSAEGLRYYSRDYVPSEGAAAVYLEATNGPVSLAHLPNPVPLASRSRKEAALEIRGLLGTLDDGETLLTDGLAGVPRHDRAEQETWADWQGPRWSPRKILGEGMGVSAALQTVAAAKALQDGSFQNAIVITTGANQHAAGMKIRRGSPD